MSGTRGRRGDGAGAPASTQPYLLRAMHEWCVDQGFTPYIAVQVDDAVDVPREYASKGEIVLNVSLEATSKLVLGNDEVTFQARFGGVARSIRVPVDHVLAIYARENGQGMAFPRLEAAAAGQAGPAAGAEPAAALAKGSGDDAPETTAGVDGPGSPAPAGGGKRPVLKRVK